MDKKREYGRMLEEGYDMMRNLERCYTRLEYLSEYIFGFTTYDGEMAELFASKALEVCAAISNSTTFEYIKDTDRYRWFLLMCNMPFFVDKLEWGSSIRGAWWYSTPGNQIELDSCGMWLDGEQITDTLTFSNNQWIEFIGILARNPWL